MTDLGWDHSAQAWIDALGPDGDLTRLHVLDAPMLGALPQTGKILDIGCGEGRFCRMARARGLETVGLDPTAALIARAKELDPKGTYIEGFAEDLPFEDARFDATIFYMTLIDIPGYRDAIAEAARVLKPGGVMLVGNLPPYVTARPRGWAGEASHWVERDGQRLYMAMDDMMEERANVTSWGDIRIENHHRPLSSYMGALLGSGLILRRFEDPPCTAPDPESRDRFKRMPWAYFMVWQKPEM